MENKELKEFLNLQLVEVNKSRDVELARVSGFYQGAEQTLKVVQKVIEDQDSKEQKVEKEKKESK